MFGYVKMMLYICIELNYEIMTREKIKKICQYHLGGIVTYKLKHYVIYAGGGKTAFSSLSDYGIELNQLAFDIFIETLQELFSSEGVEYEWDSFEWSRIQELNKLCVVEI